MSRSDVLVVGGTHGNELNAAWLIDQRSAERFLPQSVLQKVSETPTRDSLFESVFSSA